MKIFMLVFNLLMLISILKPSSLKLITLKKTVDVIMESENIKNDKEKFNLYVALALILGFIYSLVVAVYIHSVLFTILVTIWLALTIYESNVLIGYVKDGSYSKVVNSVLYKISFKIFDICIYGYIIYFSIINW